MEKPDPTPKKRGAKASMRRLLDKWKRKLFQDDTPGDVAPVVHASVATVSSPVVAQGPRDDHALPKQGLVEAQTMPACLPSAPSSAPAPAGNAIADAMLVLLSELDAEMVEEQAKEQQFKSRLSLVTSLLDMMQGPGAPGSSTAQAGPGAAADPGAMDSMTLRLRKEQARVQADHVTALDRLEVLRFAAKEWQAMLDMMKGVSVDQSHAGPLQALIFKDTMSRINAFQDQQRATRTAAAAAQGLEGQREPQQKAQPAHHATNTQLKRVPEPAVAAAAAPTAAYSGSGSTASAAAQRQQPAGQTGSRGSGSSRVDGPATPPSISGQNPGPEAAFEATSRARIQQAPTPQSRMAVGQPPRQLPGPDMQQASHAGYSHVMQCDVSSKAGCGGVTSPSSDEDAFETGRSNTVNASMASNVATRGTNIIGSSPALTPGTRSGSGSAQAAAGSKAPAGGTHLASGGGGPTNQAAVHADRTPLPRATLAAMQPGGVMPAMQRPSGPHMPPAAHFMPPAAHRQAPAAYHLPPATTQHPPAAATQHPPGATHQPTLWGHINTEAEYAAIANRQPGVVVAEPAIRAQLPLHVVHMAADHMIHTPMGATWATHDSQDFVSNCLTVARSAMHLSTTNHLATASTARMSKAAARRAAGPNPRVQAPAPPPADTPRNRRKPTSEASVGGGARLTPEEENVLVSCLEKLKTPGGGGGGQRSWEGENGDVVGGHKDQYEDECDEESGSDGYDDGSDDDEEEESGDDDEEDEEDSEDESGSQGGLGFFEVAWPAGLERQPTGSGKSSLAGMSAAQASRHSAAKGTRNGFSDSSNSTQAGSSTTTLSSHHHHQSLGSGARNASTAAAGGHPPGSMRQAMAAAMMAARAGAAAAAQVTPRAGGVARQPPGNGWQQ